MTDMDIAKLMIQAEWCAHSRHRAGERVLINGAPHVITTAARVHRHRDTRFSQEINEMFWGVPRKDLLSIASTRKGYG